MSLSEVHLSYPIFTDNIPYAAYPSLPFSACANVSVHHAILIFPAYWKCLLSTQIPASYMTTVLDVVMPCTAFCLMVALGDYMRMSANRYIYSLVTRRVFSVLLVHRRLFDAWFAMVSKSQRNGIHHVPM
ncbi:uncharacterized protein PHACADRAFT_260631 [Phanerochaete carnosa HHB-10118-sp]|uniref:Uncharacterized protein n=1 Tax=Phanerochaete carnosa (strain HHB-10118-sp) TaxID=650164 RepID=K5VZT5_PHACS|nr:uncharacterized protein PHACADRAFT_260631 [Phanerochaete carnosa HHB-10118-sp]EKM52315.1 hypothetical protein PHACADRAFT_260631 [Phanerochaete carnosa HHB-10118-sp]